MRTEQHLTDIFRALSLPLPVKEKVNQQQLFSIRTQIVFVCKTCAAFGPMLLPEIVTRGSMLCSRVPSSARTCPLRLFWHCSTTAVFVIAESSNTPSTLPLAAHICTSYAIASANDSFALLFTRPVHMTRQSGPCHDHARAWCLRQVLRAHAGECMLVPGEPLRKWAGSRPADPEQACAAADAAAAQQAQRAERERGGSVGLAHTSHNLYQPRACSARYAACCMPEVR